MTKKLRREVEPDAPSQKFLMVMCLWMFTLIVAAVAVILYANS